MMTIFSHFTDQVINEIIMWILGSNESVRTLNLAKNILITSNMTLKSLIFVIRKIWQLFLLIC